MTHFLSAAHFCLYTFLSNFKSMYTNLLFHYFLFYLPVKAGKQDDTPCCCSISSNNIICVFKIAASLNAQVLLKRHLALYSPIRLVIPFCSENSLGGEKKKKNVVVVMMVQIRLDWVGLDWRKRKYEKVLRRLICDMTRTNILRQKHHVRHAATMDSFNEQSRLRWIESC